MIHAPPCCVCGETIGIPPNDPGGSPGLAKEAARELIPCQLLSRSIGAPKYICAPCTREAVAQYALLARELIERGWVA